MLCAVCVVAAIPYSLHSTNSKQAACGKTRRALKRPGAGLCKPATWNAANNAALYGVSRFVDSSCKDEVGSCDTCVQAWMFSKPSCSGE